MKKMGFNKIMNITSPERGLIALSHFVIGWSNFDYISLVNMIYKRKIYSQKKAIPKNGF